MKSITISEIAKHIGADIIGDANKKIEGIASLEAATSSQLAFLDNPKYRKFLTSTKAGVVILHPDEVEHCPGNALVTSTPYVGYAKAAQLFNEAPTLEKGIHATAVIGENCQLSASVSIGAQVVIGNNVTIGDNTVVYPGCYIGDNVSIGNNCLLYPKVTLYYGVTLHNHVILHAGVVVGSDGFGMANHQGQWLKIPQLGSVVLHDFVEVGANTTIDRGALNDTILHKGVKLDNQIQIGHNVEIGEHTAIAACSGVSGSTKIGKYCMISGMVGFTGHFEIADKVVITGMTMVSKSITTPGIYSSGTAIEPHHTWKKNAVRFRQLDEMARKVDKLEKLLEK